MPDAQRQELAQVISAWAGLSAHLKAAILAIAQSSKTGEPE
jgi:hypothetical protein